MKNRGFIMVETILVLGVLTVGLITIYSSYALLLKNTLNKDKYENPQYLYMSSHINKYLSLINLNEKNIRVIYDSVNELNLNDHLDYLAENFNLEKIYITKMQSEITDSELKSLDGSTINYLKFLKDYTEENKNNLRLIFKYVETNGVFNNINFVSLDTGIDSGVIPPGSEEPEEPIVPEPEEPIVPEPEGVLLKDMILGPGNANVTTHLTTPGRQISTSNEAVLASTEDDYGTSYYFRGSVENNYVLFANMCWRVVRVVGDGSIKLVLYNYNTGTNSCSGTGSSYAFARYSGETYTSAFNTYYNQNAYIGFKYGTPGSASYGNEHTNNTESTILTNLKTWYNAKLTPYENLLADTIWCNDKSVDTTYVYGTTLGYAANKTGYSARGRIYAGGSYATAANPSLECPNAGSDNKLSKFTVDDEEKGNGALDKKIGLLTADEVAYAGAIYGANNPNSTYYLNQNATAIYWWWSLSPYYFLSTSASVWVVVSSGYLSYVGVGDTGGLRPAVSLVSSTKITGGNGTSSSPYIVLTN